MRVFQHARVGKLAIILAIGITVSGCSTSSMMRDLFGGGSSSSTASTSSDGITTGDGLPPDLSAAADNEAVAKLYNEGLAKLGEGEYKSAAKKFQDVERQYPYSKWATKSLIMQAYAFYQRNDYDDSINASNRFITLHPGHKDAAYAYYLIALCQYERIADVRRDQTTTQKALEALEEVERRYPGTAYAQDASRKVVLARDHLAGKEMEVGRYYLKKGSYLAGINRFKRVVTDYQTTSHTPEALYRLAEGYMALGVKSEAQTAAAVLGHNFPNSQWYKDAYTLVSSDGLQPLENQDSWISRTFKGLNPF